MSPPSSQTSVAASLSVSQLMVAESLLGLALGSPTIVTESDRFFSPGVSAAGFDSAAGLGCAADWAAGFGCAAGWAAGFGCAAGWAAGFGCAAGWATGFGCGAGWGAGVG